MWLFTPEGFYSIVTAEEFRQPLQVRARCENDLDRLRDSYFPKLGPNVSISGRDYPWRAFTTSADLAECLCRVALAIDYSNFKNEVAARMGYERAHIYGDVWSACRKIQQSHGKPPSRDRPSDQSGRETAPAIAIVNRTAEYRGRDLHAEGAWPADSKRRYGGVTFNKLGQVLLREPMNHFDGFHWTFPKGAADLDEHPVDAALRETLEETGYKPDIIGHIPAVFKGGYAGSANYFYLMLDREVAADAAAMEVNRETSAVRWALPHEARALISESTNLGGRDRDLQTLEAACREYDVLKGLPDDRGA